MLIICSEGSSHSKCYSPKGMPELSWAHTNTHARTQSEPIRVLSSKSIPCCRVIILSDYFLHFFFPEHLPEVMIPIDLGMLGRIIEFVHTLTNTRTELLHNLRCWKGASLHPGGDTLKPAFCRFSTWKQAPLVFSAKQISVNLQTTVWRSNRVSLKIKGPYVSFHIFFFL